MRLTTKSRINCICANPISMQCGKEYRPLVFSARSNFVLMVIRNFDPLWCQNAIYICVNAGYNLFNTLL